MEERLTLEVAALDAEGHGVARNPDGKVVFVEDALPGERVVARLVRSRRSYDLMRATAVLRASAGRRTPRCAHFGVCGGCATQHAEARLQVAAKQRWLEDCLERIGKLRPEAMLAPIYGSEWGYRHRARLAVRRVAKKGGVLVGFHERRSSYVADMCGCEVLPARVAGLIPALRALVERLSVRERLPQIEVAVGEDGFALVFRHLLPLTHADEAELRAFAQSSGAWVWLQPRGPDSAHPFEPRAAPPLHYTLPEFDVRIEFRPNDFTQVNHAVNRALVSRAVRLLAPQPGERIADLYCGLGNFSLPLARAGAVVSGFEGSEALVERARRNAELNGLHVDFATADLAAGGIEARGRFDKLLLDPPREGTVELVKALPATWPRKIVYVSCDPATLARDAGVLAHAQGFALRAAGVVNMFPHTAHVESIALFER